MRLGELILQERLAPVDAIEEALESQVLHGGRLGTNLVELGVVSENDLARILGKQHGLPFALGEMIPDPAALKLVPAAKCDDLDLIPMRVDGTRLTVAVVHPQVLPGLNELAFKVGKRLVPVVIPEFRMHQLLRRHCKAFRQIRSLDLNVVRARKSAEAAPTTPDPAQDLMGEEEFQSMYYRALRGGEGAQSPGSTAAAEEDLEVITGEVVEEPSAPAVEAPAPAPAAHTSPLSFVEAQKLLQASEDREDIARTVLRFARSKWQRVLLLSIQGDLVTGWHGMGQGVNELNVRRIGVFLQKDSTFKLVRDTRSHYVGPTKREPGTAGFFKLLGGGFPSTVVMMPLLVRGKPVHILYVDDGPGQFTTPDIGELLILAQSVARSYEALIKKRRAQARG